MDQGLTVRRATPADAEGIVELNARWNGADAGVEVAASLAAPEIGTRTYAVAVDGARVVSTVGLLSVRFVVDGVSVPVGQPEFVATDPDYRGRGLVRRLFRLVEGWSHERGDLAQMVAGIPFFYRQLGYHYAVRTPERRFVPADAPVPTADGWAVRPATMSDLADVRALQADTQRTSALQVAFTDEIWPVLLALPHAPVVVAERDDGRVGGIARVGVHDGRAQLRAAAATDVGAARALVHHARRAHPGAPTVVPDRQGSAMSAVLATASYPLPDRSWLYVRVADPVTLLDHLRPVLSRRLGANPSVEDGSVVLSLYRSQVRLELAGGTCTAVSGEDGVHEERDDVAAVPPDLLPELVFGPRGAVGLEDHPDVAPGPHRGLLRALFPPLTSDVLLW